MNYEDQPLNEEEQKLLDLIYSRLDIFRDKCSPYHEDAKKARKVVHMDDPEQEINPKAKKKTLQLHTLKSTIDNVVADQMDNMPEAKLAPETSDMQAYSDDLQDMVHHVFYVANDFDAIQHRRAEDFYVTGTAITQIARDETMNHGKGEIAVIRYPVEAFLWDAMADDIQEARAVMKLGWHPMSWFRAHYPDTAKYICADGQSRSNVGMTEGQENADHGSDEERALLIEYWYREFDAKTRKYSINMAYAAGGALLENHKNVYAHGMYPFVVDTMDHQEGVMVGEGLAHQFAPIMRYINRYASYIDMNARMSSKGRVLMRKGSGIDPDKFANMENDIVEGDRIEQGVDWAWIQSSPFPGSVAQQMFELQTELKQDSGANQFTRGETTGGIVSGKAINALIEAGGKISHMRTDQLNAGFKKMVEQVLWLMAEFYDDERLNLMTGHAPDGSKKKVQDFFGKTKGSVPPPPYTVQIEVITRDPQRIANQNQMFLEAYTMAAQAQQFFPLSSLFQILNLDGKDKIMPVIMQNEHYQEQMQQMQAQLEQMSQQMAGMQKENENLRSTTNQLTNTLASVSARTGNGYSLGSPPGETNEDVVNNARTALL